MGRDDKILNLFDSMSGAIKSLVNEDITIDDIVFKLHRVFTVIQCYIFCYLLFKSGKMLIITKRNDGQTIFYRNRYIKPSASYYLFSILEMLWNAPRTFPRRRKRKSLTKSWLTHIAGYTEPIPENLTFTNTRILLKQRVEQNGTIIMQAVVLRRDMIVGTICTTSSFRLF